VRLSSTAYLTLSMTESILYQVTATNKAIVRDDSGQIHQAYAVSTATMQREGQLENSTIACPNAAGTPAYMKNNQRKLLKEGLPCR